MCKKWILIVKCQQYYILLYCVCWWRASLSDRFSSGRSFTGVLWSSTARPHGNIPLLKVGVRRPLVERFQRGKPSVTLLLFGLDQHLIFGADEGIFTLNLNGSETTMELVRDPNTSWWHSQVHFSRFDFFFLSQLFPGKCVWVYTIGNVLMSVSGEEQSTTRLWKTWQVCQEPESPLFM